MATDYQALIKLTERLQKENLEMAHFINDVKPLLKLIKENAEYRELLPLVHVLEVTHEVVSRRD